MTSTSYHLRLKEASCVICKHSTEPHAYEFPIEERPKVAAVIRNTLSERPITTLSFEFPTHGHDFQYADVSTHSGEERWRLCRHPSCPTCLASPDAFVFHTDCFHILMEMAREQTQDRRLGCENGLLIHETLWQVWLAGHWSRPWAKVSYEALPPPCPVPTLLAGSRTTEDTNPESTRLLVEKLQLLPAELFQQIVTYSPKSFLWRYAAACIWPSRSFRKLKDSKSIMLAPNDLPGWRRGKDLLYGWRRWFGLGIAALALDILWDRVPILALQKGCRQQFVRLTLDCHGIERVEFLDHWPTRSGHRPGASWYIVEKSSWLGDFHLQSQGGFLRLEPKTPTGACVLWDTPNPPAWDSCYYFGEGSEDTQRMRSISLDQNITGMTAFCTGGRIYGIHAHHGKTSAVDTYSRLTKRLQEEVVWLYFPLEPGEVVYNVLIRYRHQSPTPKSSNPIIVMHTSHGRLYTCGQYIEPSDSRYEYHRLCSRPIGQLLYRDPDPGQPILYFGVDSHPTAGAEPALENLDSVYCPIHRDSIYYSHASLENVNSVQCFYDLCIEEQPAQWCIGILLEYSNKHRAALGQCRIGASHSIQVTAPTGMHVKRVVDRSGLSGVMVRFTSSDTLEQLDRLGWECMKMKGEIVWWFDHGIVKISYSQESRQL